MKSPLEQNYYELLEIPRDATVAEIDRAYDRARAYYGSGSVATYTLAAPDELKRVQDRIDEAYLILADDKARTEYDQRVGPPGPGERPLHREVRETREKEAARETAKRESTPPPTPAVPAPNARPPSNRPPTDGPIPPPPMAFPEPAPPATKVPAKPAEAEPPPPAAAPDLSDDAVFTGELLRRVREQRGMSLQDISDRTKIGRNHLENIEAERHAALPAQVYLRGFLMALARELRLDPLRVSKSYMEQLAAQQGKGPKPRG